MHEKLAANYVICIVCWSVINLTDSFFLAVVFWKLKQNVIMFHANIGYLLVPGTLLLLLSNILWMCVSGISALRIWSWISRTLPSLMIWPQCWLLIRFSDLQPIRWIRGTLHCQVIETESVSLIFYICSKFSNLVFCVIIELLWSYLSDTNAEKLAFYSMWCDLIILHAFEVWI